MEKLISCAFNIDTACVELHFTDGSIYSINCTAVENEVADNRFQRAELDYLIYNDPLAYADLVLNGARKMQKAMISLPVFPCVTWANVLPQNLCRRMMDV